MNLEDQSVMESRFNSPLAPNGGIVRFVCGTNLGWFVIGLICCAFLTPIGGWGQQVQVTVNVLPPYSAYLQDYPGRGNQVQIFVRNTTSAALEVRFLGTITGDNGVRIATPQNFRPLVPLRLAPLENKLLTRSDLEGLFDLAQIDVQGVDKAQLYRGMPLPEGNYQLCVQAFDNRTSRALSADFPLGCSGLFTLKSVEPPILINPICDSKITPNIPQSVVFSWTPPVGVSPAQVSYTLRVIELPDVAPPANMGNKEMVAPAQQAQIGNQKRNSQDVKYTNKPPQPNVNAGTFSAPAPSLTMGYDPNIFIDAVVLPPTGVEVKNLRTTSFLYGPNQPTLKVGKRYAVRVQASDPLRKINFLNEGKSPVCYFTYGEDGSQFPTFPVFANNTPTDSNGKPKPIFAKSGEFIKCSCNANEVGDTKVDNSTVLANKSAQIGLFTLQLLNNVKEENGVLNGDGMIPIPMLNSQYVKLRVRLYDVQCNASGQVISGVVRAKLSNKADPSLFPNYDKPDYEAPSLNSEQIGSISNFLSTQQDMLLSSLKNSKESIGFEIPFGIDKSFGSVNTIIAITNFTFTAKNAYFDANTWVQVANGQVNGIALSGYNMCISPDKPCGEGILYLAENMKLSEFFALKGAANVPPKGPFEGPDTTLVTHVIFDENGYKQLRVHGLITPPGLVNAETNGPVEISVNAGMVDFQNWTAQLSFPKFYVQGLSDFKFSMKPGKPALYDHSETTTPAKLPEGYLENPAIELNLWQGLYFPELSLELPAFFKHSNGQPLTIGIADMIHDDKGFSGKAFVNNILDVGEGSLDSWYYSIDELSVTFLKSTFKESGMLGKVVLPIFKSKGKNEKGQEVFDQSAQLPYSCTLSKDENGGGLNVQFVMSPKDNMEVEIWKASLNLDPSTNIKVTYNSQGFEAKAVLNGHIDIDAVYFKIPAVKFEEITLSSNAPHFTLKSLGMASPQKEMSSFPLTLTDIKADFDNSKAAQGLYGFKFGGKLDLTGEGEKGFSATAGAVLYFSAGLKENRPNWEFKEIKPTEVGIDTKIGPIEVAGKLNFYDEEDKVYGEGLKGTVTMTVPGVVAGEVEAQFGQVNGFRYWHVGGKIGIGSGIPIGATPLSFKRFGGGMYSKMNKVIDKEGNIMYVPASSVGKGFEATVGVGLTTPDVFEMDGTFSISFNSDYSINDAALTMDAWLLGATKSQAMAKGTASIRYDFSQEIFAATLSLQAGYSAGPLTVKAEVRDSYLNIDGKTGNWFLALGLPPGGQRVGLDIAVAGLGSYHFGSYFMIGNYTPSEVGPLPPAPYGMSQATLNALNYTNKTASMLKKTDSPILAFGAGYKLNADFGVGPFHLRFDGGVGFDLALMKRDECNGALPGFNGWYAVGQIYAYMHFSLDLDIDTWVYEGRMTVAELDAAALLRGGMINPIWLNGHVLLKYRVLGGLVKGKVNFDFWYNQDKKCDPEAIFSPPNPFAAQPLIAAVGPSGTDKKTSILSAFYAEFNYPVESDILLDLEIPAGSKLEAGAQGTTYPGPNGSTILHREFRLQFKDNARFNAIATSIDPEFVSCQSPNTGRISWENDEDGYPNFKATYYRANALLPKSTYELTVGVQVWIRNKGKLEPYTFKGSTVEQTEKVTFMTGECISVLAKGPDENSVVLTSYPYEGQRFFMKGDEAETFVKFKTNISCCMKNLNSDDLYELKVRFSPLEGAQFADSKSPNTLMADAKFQGDKVTYKLPFGLKNKTLYRFDLVRIPRADFVQKQYLEAQKVKESTKKIAQANIYVAGGGAKNTVASLNSTPSLAKNIGAGTGAWGAGINAKAESYVKNYTELSMEEYEKKVSDKANKFGLNTIVSNEKMMADGQFNIKKSADLVKKEATEMENYKKALEVSMYRYYFKTSKFSTLKEKMAELQFPIAEQTVGSRVLGAVQGKIRTSEGFDTFEVTSEKLDGDTFRPPLILLRADPTSNWFKNVAIPIAELLDKIPAGYYDEVGKGKPTKGMSDIFQRSMVRISNMFEVPMKPFKNEEVEQWIKPAKQ